MTAADRETDPHKKYELSKTTMILLLYKANGVPSSPLKEAEIKWDIYKRDVAIYDAWKKGQ